MLHPYANLTTPGIDVFHGGTEAEALKEAARLASDCIKFIPKDKRVLLINTMIDAQSFEDVVGTYARRAPRLKCETYLESSFMEKLEMLEKSIASMNIAVLVITNFDCAALTQRHRVLLGQRLRAIRNNSKIRIIVFMQNKPGYYGVNGSLRYCSRMMAEVGTWNGNKTAEVTDSVIEESKELEQSLVQELTKEQEELEREQALAEEAAQRLEQRRAFLMNKYGLLDKENAAMAEKIILTEPIDEYEEVELLANMVQSFDKETFSNFLVHFQGKFDTEVSQIARLEFQRRNGHGKGYELKPRPTKPNVLQGEPLKNKELGYANVA